MTIRVNIVVEALLDSMNFESNRLSFYACVASQKYRWCLLIQEKIGELQNQTAESQIETHREILEEVNDYVGLKKNLSKRLDRVIF